MRRTFLGWALAGLLVLAGWSAAAVFPTSTLWVDAGSKCNNPDGTLERPFKTINAALAHLPQTGGTLKVKSGLYREAVRLTSHCTLEAAPGAKVTISGMEAITGWRPIGQGIYKALVESAAGDVFTCPKAAQGLIFHGNVCVGSGANMLIFGHSNAGKALLEYNTFCFTGYSCLNFTASDYTVRHNVFVLGHKGFFFGLRGVKNYSGDYNLFWAAPQAEGGIATDKGWFGSFTAFKQANPELEVHSEYAEPQFKSAPVGFAVLDGKRLTENTHSKLYLRPGGGPFEAGDYVELDFDGKPHKVTRVRGDEITLKPALARLPLKEKLVVNWGKQPGFAWDLRLEATSPGWKLGKAGKACGAGLDMAAFQRCDFDGDGKREVPEYPKE